MRRLLTGYVLGFNRRHNRHGQLFQNRFKSIICQEDAYLLELVRYIHLNPIRAGIVTTLSDLQRFKFSGHASLMGTLERKWHEDNWRAIWVGDKRVEVNRALIPTIRIFVFKNIQAETVGHGKASAADRPDGAL